MVDITEISAIVAAAGVLVGVVLTVIELRNLVKQRKSDLLMRLHLAFSTKEMVEALQKYMSTEYKDARALKAGENGPTTHALENGSNTSTMK